MSDLDLRVPGFGAMSLSGAYGPANDDQSMDVLRMACQLGCTFWDTASVYGFGHGEELIGKFLAENPGARDKLFIGSKCGWEFDPISKTRTGLSNTPEHIHSFIDETIARLGTTPDLYYLHRRDPRTPLEVSIGALIDIKKAGKTKYIGISEPSADTLREACKIGHVDFVQIEYSPFCLVPEQNGLLDAARELGVHVVAFSPLGVGVLTGEYSDPKRFEKDLRGQSPRFQGEAFERNLQIVEAFRALSEKKGCTPAQLALAWVIKQGAIPIPGTKSVQRLEENWGAHDISYRTLRRRRSVRSSNPALRGRGGHHVSWLIWAIDRRRSSVVNVHRCTSFCSRGTGNSRFICIISLMTKAGYQTNLSATTRPSIPHLVQWCPYVSGVLGIEMIFGAGLES